MSSVSTGRRVLSAMALIGLAACSGQQTTSPLVPNVAAPPAGADVSPLGSPLMFTANRDGGKRHVGGLLAFHFDANGNVKPAARIAGSNTTLYEPDAIAIDSNRNIYAADDSGTKVAVFAPNAHGNVAPIRIIGGSNSKLGPTEGIMIDPSGDLWVSSYTNNDVTEYAPNAKGNVAPMNTIAGSNTQLNRPDGMTMDSKGRLFVANAGSITVYAKGASGNVSPLGVISGNYTGLERPFALAIDGNGRLLVADENAGVLVFANAEQLGNVPPTAHIMGFNGSDGVMADKSGDIYVADFANKAIKVYASNANGYATPLRTIQGSNTSLNGPSFLAQQ